MSNWLKQSTAACILLGPLVDNTDGFTPETSLTFNATDVRLSKNGGEFAAKNDATAPSSNEFGWWEITLNTTDTDTVGDFIIAASVTGALPAWRTYMILNGSSYDALVSGNGGMVVKSGSVTDKVNYGLSGSALGEVSASVSTASGVWVYSGARTLSASSIAASTIATSAFYSTAFAGSAINNQNFALTAASQVWDSAVKTITGGSVTGGSVIAITVLDKTEYGLSASAVDEVWNEAKAEHTSVSTFGYYLDKQITAITGTGATAQEVWEYSGSRWITGGSVSTASNADISYVGGSAVVVSSCVMANLSASAVDEIWDEAKAGHTSVSTFGYYLDKQITAITGTGATAEEVWTYSGSRWITGGSVIATSGSVTAISVTDKVNYGLSASAVDEIWNEPKAGHTTASTYGNYLDKEITGITGTGATAAEVWTYGTRALSASSIAASTIASSAIDANAFALTAGSKVWDAAVRTITGGTITTVAASGISASSIAASALYTNAFPASAINNVNFAVSAGSQIWNAAVRAITGGSVVATSGSVVATTLLAMSASVIDASAIAASAIRQPAVAADTGSVIWNVAVRSLTDKTNYGLSASALGEISASVSTASGVWVYGTRALTDKVNFGISASAVDEIWNESQVGHTAASSFGSYVDAKISESGGSSTGATPQEVWEYTTRTLSASSIAASTLATNAIDTNSFATNAASKIWDATVRTITGGSVVATSGSVVTTTNLDKTNYVLAASSIGPSTIAASTISNGIFALTAASQIWNAATRTITGGSVVATSGSVVATNVLAITASAINASAFAASAIHKAAITTDSGSIVWDSAIRTITGGSVVATSGSVVATNILDKTGYSIAASGIGSTAIASSAINSESITDGAKNSITNNLLKFDLSTITGEASRSVINALRFLRNKWSISGTTLTITKEDDSTAAWTAALTSASNAETITSVDPT